MIDPHAGHPSLGDEPGQQSVDRREDVGILDAQAGERVDVEEAPVVDLVRRGAPVGEAIGLLLEQLVQRVERLRLPGRPVVLPQDLVALGRRAIGQALQFRHMARVDRQAVIEVGEHELILVELERELAALEDLPVLIAEDRQQQLAPQLRP